MTTNIPEEKIIVEYIASRWRRKPIPTELRKLEQKHYNFISGRQMSDGPWLRALRTGLGITTEAMAEKLNTNRSGVLRYEHNEVSKKITLYSLQAWADATDCELVYGFIPKDQPTFSHLIVSRSLPFLDDEWMQKLNLPTERKARTLHSRMMSFLGHKNGWSKIWGHKKILKTSNFNWFKSKKHLYY